MDKRSYKKAVGWQFGKRNTSKLRRIRTSISLRKRKFAMLKSVGMTPKGFIFGHQLNKKLRPRNIVGFLVFYVI
ncbi:hypothetical protein [Desulfosporosinus shakirovi]|uniref:hypothetical protein n=1 Tax=Desulfosporosinus shakirovi TaxID=2885154 RepID=UPI001E3504B6|nr:hypothetical protein [Desulfosporosinus sp. SRJS8]MCB8817866.1 hypothetical protein [Desulfosporosinus sp. SRJS8]